MLLEEGDDDKVPQSSCRREEELESRGAAAEGVDGGRVVGNLPVGEA